MRYWSNLSWSVLPNLRCMDFASSRRRSRWLPVWESPFLWASMDSPLRPKSLSKTIAGRLKEGMGWPVFEKDSVFARVGMPVPPSEDSARVENLVSEPRRWVCAMNWSSEIEFFNPFAFRLISSPVRNVSPLSWPPILLTFGWHRPPRTVTWSRNLLSGSNDLLKVKFLPSPWGNQFHWLNSLSWLGRLTPYGK